MAALRKQWVSDYAWPTAVAAAVGVAIWVPTMAMQPRYGGDPNSKNGLWFMALMLFAAVVLAVIFSEHSSTLAIALVTPQLILAPFTTPRGDNDGLWGLIFIMLPVGAIGSKPVEYPKPNWGS